MSKRKSERRVTVTYRLPRVLNKNIAAYSVQEDLSKNDIAVEALNNFLTSKGIDSRVLPKFFTPRK